MTLLPSQILPPAAARPAPTMQRRITLGAAGRDPNSPVYVHCSFDDSGSLSHGNDPIGARYEEAKRALRHIANSSRTNMQQVAIYRFDHPNVPSIGPLPLHKKKPLAELLAAVDPPERITGASTLTPAMMAMNRAAEKQPDAAHVAVIFSDFELFDLNPSQPYEEIAAFPGLVHAVVMNAAPPAELQALSSVLITQVSSLDPPGRLAAALANSLTRHRPGAGQPSYQLKPLSPASKRAGPHGPL